MLLKLLIVFSLFSTIKTKGYKNLVDLPLKVPKGSSVINATLTDTTGFKKYFIQELISASGSTIAGKIVISSDKDSYTIHYNADTGVDSKERLVIHGSECLLFTFKNVWNKYLPGIQKPLLNTILLMGPSLLYRLDHSVFVWETDDSLFKDVRGSMMRSASTKMDGKLKITYYYKYLLDDETGINSPSRIELSSSLPPNEDLILDIYFQSESVVDRFEREVQPLPGIGCPHYLSGVKNLPALKAFHLHYSMYEYIQGSTTSKSFNEEHKDGIPVEAWESVQYNVKINGKTVDKAVITQYFAQSNAHIFWDYTLVSTKISIYNYNQQKQVYTLTDGITRDYVDFREERSGESIVSFLEQVAYLHKEGTLTLTFVLQCDDSDPLHASCLKHTKDRVTWLKGDFLYFVLLAKPVSILRISDIQYRFTDTKVEMEVTFIDLIDLKHIFDAKFMSVSPETMAKMKTIKAATEDECITKLTFYYEPIKAIFFQATDLTCGYWTDLEGFKEDYKQGRSGSVYRFPLQNLNRVKQELPLDKIHDAFLQDVGQTYSLFNRDTHISFKLIDVIDSTAKVSGLDKDIIAQIRWDAKLKVEGQFTVIVPDAKTFSDCYRNCIDSETVSCNILSFCHTDDGGKLDCRVSSLQLSDVVNEDLHIEHDLKCKIFRINILKDYSEVANRKFKNSNSAALQKGLDSCAASCHASPDCTSFQYCSGDCSFDGLFTDADTEYDEQCEIYFPKASEKYQKTGNKIVSEVFHTETKLTLDQCASLCYGLSDSDTRCQSFNYCPKSRTESSCALTKFSVKSSDTKTIEGGDCSNFELKVKSNGKKNQKSSSIDTVEGMSGSGAFGIITMFLFVGVLLGLVSPYAYSKVSKMREPSKLGRNFGWTRQTDEQ